VKSTREYKKQSKLNSGMNFQSLLYHEYNINIHTLYGRSTLLALCYPPASLCGGPRLSPAQSVWDEADQTAWAQFFLPVRRFSRISINPPMLQVILHSFIPTLPMLYKKNGKHRQIKHLNEIRMTVVSRLRTCLNFQRLLRKLFI